ncbi:MAG: uncharacterized membrane protein YbhN (UPF0104 family) [Lentimonas sp.]|jgi:uncharacterized membrane protein YbhN (UPF0104 family)
MSSIMRRYILRAAGVLVICGIYAFIFRQISFDFSEVRSSEVEVALLPVLYAVSLIFLSFLFRCLAWDVTFRKFGHMLPLLRTARILAISNLGRYVPGKVATVGGVLFLASKEGIPPRVSGTALFINLVVPLLTAAFIFALSLIFLDLQFSFGSALWVLGGLILVASTACLQPPLFNRLSAFLYRKVRGGEFDCKLSYSFLYQNTLFILIGWAAQGLAFFFLSRAFFEIPFASLPFFIGGNAIAFMLGLISVFAPAGLGVKEGVLYLALTQCLPAAQVAVLVLVWRIFTTVVELVLAGGFFLCGFWRVSAEKA